MMQVIDIVLIAVTIVLAVAAIVLNGLVSSVIVAAEKVTRNLACLVFLCGANLELSVLMIVHGSVELSMMGNFTGSTNSSTGSTNSSIGANFSALGCTAVIVECLGKGAVLWGICALTSLCVNQYVYIERPFWYDLHVTSRRLVLANSMAGVICHVIGLIPLIQTGIFQKSVCHPEDVAGAKEFILVFTILIFLFFTIIVALSIRMLVMAEGHRKKIKEHNTLKSSRADSIKFFITLVCTYLVAYLTPAVCGTVDAYDPLLKIPHLKLRSLYLLGPIIYAVLYGSRIPEGFFRSVRLAICCCLPVKPVEKEVEIIDVVRLAVMRLGHVMVKIDKQAAIKRHSSYLKRRSRIINSMTFLKPTPKPRQHETLRPYKSFIPTTGNKEDEDIKKESVSRAVSLDAAKVARRSAAKSSTGRILSWLPGYGSTKSSFEVHKTAEKSEEDIESQGVLLTSLTATKNSSRKLSAIVENSEAMQERHSDDETTSISPSIDQ